MSFSTNSSQQISIFDATANLTQREIKMLENRGQNTLLKIYFLQSMKNHSKFFIVIAPQDITHR